MTSTDIAPPPRPPTGRRLGVNSDELAMWAERSALPVVWLALIVVYGMNVNFTWPVIELVKPRIDCP